MKIIAGIEFGYALPTVIIVMDVGSSKILKEFSQAELTIDETLYQIKILQEKYDVETFYTDHTLPEYIKYLRKAGIDIITTVYDIEYIVNEERALLYINDAVERSYKEKIIHMKKNIREKIKRKKFLMDENYPVWEGKYDTKEYRDASRTMELVIEIVEAIRNIRGKLNVNPVAKINMSYFSNNEKKRNTINENIEMIKTLAKVNTFEYKSKGRDENIIMVGDIGLVLKNMDIDKNQTRKAIERIDKDIKFLNNRLQNKQFIENAAKEVISETKNKIIIAKEKKRILRGDMR